MLSRFIVQRTPCATCRLRQNIAAKVLARSRKSAIPNPRLAFTQKRGFVGSAARRRDESLDGKGRAPRKTFAYEQEEARLDDRQDPGSGSGKAAGEAERLDEDVPVEEEQEEIEDVDEEGLPAMSPEQMRTNGQMLYLMLRKSDDPVKATEELLDKMSETATVDERARLAKESFGEALPDGLLDEEEERAYVRLFGKPVRLEDREWQEGLAAIMQGEEGEGEIEQEGNAILREGEDGELEEVEVDDAELVDDLDGEDGKEMGSTKTSVRDTRDAEGMEEVLEDEADEDYADTGADPNLRAHPLTSANRFTTSPSTLPLPKYGMVEPIQLLLSGIPNAHLKDSAHRVFGGVGLPHSTSTPGLAKTMQQKAIPLDASQGRMSDIDASSYIAVLMPAIYATVMSVLVETRKRLGTAWAEDLVRKAEAGELRILDAGGAGAGVLAVRELLRAEWQRMHEEDDTNESGTELATADGKLGGAELAAPLGQATVLTGSDALRQRASALLENTTFIPRLPDYVHTETAKQSGKFDLVIAPHTIWPIREDWLRKTHVENLWSLLNASGGVLVMLEKGVARGFEAIAGAREHLLNSRISSPGSENRAANIQEPEISWETPEKEHGMIIAPCTNHTDCPMYAGKNKGNIKGRKDICHFEQRYVRPRAHQQILGARDKNFEDVKFSYVAMMRGHDLRQTESSPIFDNSSPVSQGDEATDRAFEGYGDLPSTSLQPNSLSLPRQILRPLKRRGHVILDLCTPSGSLERWTVPKSFGKQAFRDARKAGWGDLWALGAKTRVLRSARVGDKKRGKVDKERVTDEEVLDVDLDEEGRVAKKGISKRKLKEKRRVKERKAGRQGVLLGREEFS